MKFFVAVYAFLALTAHADSEVTADTPAPLFNVLAVKSLPDTYDNGPDGRPSHRCTVDEDHPLMTIYSLKDLLLEPDNEGVRIVFTDKDAATFLKFTHQYPLLCISGDKKATVILKTDGFQGWITFTKTHYTGPMAAYLRKRFHIAPGTNTSTSTPSAPAPTPAPSAAKT